MRARSIFAPNAVPFPTYLVFLFSSGYWTGFGFVIESSGE